jgi:toxin ParE1/3/4
MVRINWTNQARDDLKNIFEFISQDSFGYAKIQIIRLRSSTKKLKDHPKIGRIVPEFGSEQIREIIVGNYRVVYRVVSENRLDILTVHHSARDLQKRIK